MDMKLAQTLLSDLLLRCEREELANLNDVGMLSIAFPRKHRPHVSVLCCRIR